MYFYQNKFLFCPYSNIAMPPPPPVRSRKDLESRTFVAFIHDMVANKDEYSRILPQMSYVVGRTLVILCTKWHRALEHPTSPAPTIKIVNKILGDVFDSQYVTMRYIRALPGEPPHLRSSANSSRKCWLWDWDQVARYAATNPPPIPTV